jgi:hypothetical protein
MAIEKSAWAFLYMSQILLAILLAARIQIHLPPFLTRFADRHTPPTRAASCNLKIVGFRFVGLPKQRFEYDGTMYEIGAEGFVELVADPQPRMTYQFEKETLALPNGPADQFGLVEVRLPAVR